MMEIAIEKAYGVEAPWFITSTRDGLEEEGTLSVNHFTLMREVNDNPERSLENFIQSLKSKR